MCPTTIVKSTIFQPGERIPLCSDEHQALIKVKLTHLFLYLITTSSFSLNGSLGVTGCQLSDNRTAVSRSAKEPQAPRGWIKSISSCQSP